MKIILMIVLIVVVLYLFLILPRLTKQKEAKKFIGRYYTHRGFHNNTSEAPENSLSSFSKAVEGDYGIELDVQLTKDEVMVVFHDEDLRRACGQEGKVKEYTYEELCDFTLFESEERIPTFENVLKLVDGKVPLIVEIKMSDTSLRVCEVVNQQLMNYKGPYCIESFNPIAVRWYKKNNSEVIRGQLSSALNKEMEKKGEKKDFTLYLVEYLFTNFLTRPDFIAYNHLYKNNLSRKICRNVFQCLSVTWTIKSEEQLKAAEKNFDIFIFEGFIPK